MELAILNTSIVTSDGVYRLETIDEGDARSQVARAAAVRSYVGHPATAAILTEILGCEVPVSRDLFAQAPGQKALVFKLDGRPEPGRELDRQELERIGFGFKLLIRH